jgi:hypothetical protein
MSEPACARFKPLETGGQRRSSIRELGSAAVQLRATVGKRRLAAAQAGGEYMSAFGLVTGEDEGFDEALGFARLARERRIARCRTGEGRSQVSSACQPPAADHRQEPTQFVAQRVRSKCGIVLAGGDPL